MYEIGAVTYILLQSLSLYNSSWFKKPILVILARLGRSNFKRLIKLLFLGGEHNDSLINGAIEVEF